MSSRYPLSLSKSLYMSSRHCPTKLRYQLSPSSYTNSKSGDSFLKELALTGTLVGKLGRLKFYDRKQCGLEPGEVRFEVEVETKRTNVHPPLYARIDVLVVEEIAGSESTAQSSDPSLSRKLHKLIEVKRKVFDGSIPPSLQLVDKKGTSILAPFESILHDVAFQKYAYDRM